jgi:hypothetical protein
LPCNRNISNSSNVKYIDTQCFQLLQLLIYQSRYLGNDLGQVTGTELCRCQTNSETNRHLVQRIQSPRSLRTVETRQSCSRISLRASWSPKRRSLTMTWTRLSQFGLPRLLLPYELLRTGKSSRTTVPSRSSSSSRTLRSALGRCSC